MDCVPSSFNGEPDSVYGKHYRRSRQDHFPEQHGCLLSVVGLRDPLESDSSPEPERTLSWIDLGPVVYGLLLTFLSD